MRSNDLTTALVITIISFFSFTMAWEVAIVDGPQSILYGFPLPYVTDSWYTSLAKQFFILPFLLDFLTYLAFWTILWLGINKIIGPIQIPDWLEYLGFVGAVIFVGFAVMGLLLGDHSYYLFKPFEMEVLKSTFQVIGLH